MTDNKQEVQTKKVQEQTNENMLQELKMRVEILKLNQQAKELENSKYNEIDADTVEKVDFIYGVKVDKEIVEDFKKGYEQAFKKGVGE